MTAATAPRERRRISPLRILLVLIALGAVVGIGAKAAVTLVAESRAASTQTWFAPYVDVTLTPTLYFEEPNEQPARDVVLGFIVADPADACSPSWGTYYSLDAAARALDLDRRIVRLREREGDAIVSFGGAQNNELAVVCTDVTKLTAAYQAVIDRYGLTAVDFDIEGTALADTAANERRAEAIARLQEKNEGLAVWFTLPVAVQGLMIESVDLLDATLAGGVELSGVNVMTMNFGDSRAGMPLRDAIEASLLATFTQLDGVYQRAGQPKTEDELWRLIGATPMIGRNDIPSDVFTPSDAEALVEFASRVNLRRISFWSANRDVACGAAVDDDRVSNTCSGVSQEPLEFGNIFASGAPARTIEAPTPTPNPENDTRAAGLARDDPSSSPYPLWRSAKAYTEGAKVVWQGRVYQAKWWTQGDQPDAPVKHVWETPWRYLGPVLESDREAVRSTEPVADGTYSRWVAETVYVAGNEVEHNGKVFRAKWWTQGDEPQEDPDQAYDHPWAYIGKVKTDDTAQDAGGG